MSFSVFTNQQINGKREAKSSDIKSLLTELVRCVMLVQRIYDLNYIITKIEMFNVYPLLFLR